MAATNRSKDDLINETTGLYKDNAAGDISAADLRDGVYSIFQPQGICQGRLTLESGVPVSTTDQTAKTTVYFTPYNGDCVSLFDGTSWKLYQFTELSLALGTITSGKNYDVFLYDNAGTLTLEMSAAWTTDTARADALTTQNGIYVKSGATTRRYLGTFRTASTTTTQLIFGGTDTAAKMFLWNQYNRVAASLSLRDSTDSWSYTTAAYRQRRASATNQVEIVVGLAGDMFDMRTNQMCQTDANQHIKCAIGYDSTTMPSGITAQLSCTSSQITTTVTTSFSNMPSAGYHYYAELEQGNGAGTSTWFGDAGVPTTHLNGSVANWRY